MVLGLDMRFLGRKRQKKNYYDSKDNKISPLTLRSSLRAADLFSTFFDCQLRRVVSDHWLGALPIASRSAIICGGS
jgi:hypothetical protein